MRRCMPEEIEGWFSPAHMRSQFSDGSTPCRDTYKLYFGGLGMSA